MGVYPRVLADGYLQSWKQCTNQGDGDLHVLVRINILGSQLGFSHTPTLLGEGDD